MLIGLGLGPGDPELLTLRAVRILREADRVYVPGRIARSIVAPYRDAEELEFPMTDDEERIRTCMERNADQIAEYVQSGMVAIGILGDPHFFSTFFRLAAAVTDRVPGAEIRTEPGISAITAFAAAAGISVTSNFTVMQDDTRPGVLVRLKVRHPRALAGSLKTEGYRHFILVERMYMDGTRISIGDTLPVESDYMSVLFARR